MKRGRPPTTTHGEVASVALGLFERNGFEATTVDEIAAAVGVSRRTVFRYFPSKNDMVWGDFDWVLRRLRAELDEVPPDEPLATALGRAVVASNWYPEAELPDLRVRMTLITTVPALQAHSMLRYADWCRVVAEFAGQRLGEEPDDLVPQAIAHAALGTSMAAFGCWVRSPGDDLERNLERGFELLASGYAGALSAERPA
jgi:mycofactocin system transcriptional regulator